MTVHCLATGADGTVDTDTDSLYVVPSLQPGNYRVQATAAGFSPYTLEKVTLDVARQVTVNIHLAVASAGATV
ncbi:MAG: carboxypeptidase-like regulatory domain-containing protein [Terracidiphilus sp.]